MENKIQVLPEELCNKIAAGEVVERPSSVVKELLENAIDAGASDILVELESGGKKLIRVTDNGSGMGRQDAFLSLERHATSKIRSDADLFALTTLGFRGEALASIASVSRLRLKTCGNDQGLGQEIYAEGGTIRKAEEIGLPRGTVVEVRNLFFNLPARRKFLRKDQTELGHAADVVTKQALAHPAVGFRLKHDGRMLVELRREKGVRERVAALLGRSLLNDLLVVDRQAGEDLQLSGLISQPQLTRSGANHVYTFINGRYIRDRVVQHAIMEGYRHLLMKGRYPVAILFLRLDPEQVDVNVHPTKHEVRFREQTLIHDFIVQTLQKTLRPAPWVGGSEPRLPSTEHGGTPPLAPTSSSMEQPAVLKEPVPDYRRAQPINAPTPELPAPEISSAVVESTARTQLALQTEAAAGFFANLQILGQYHQSYLLCQDGEDLVLIDQHAAHERITFEKLRLDYGTGAVASQSLLFPEILELDFRSAAALGDYREELERLGFEIEPFGGKSFALKAIPQILPNGDAARLVTDVALELERLGRSGRIQEIIDEVLILMACHGSVRANQAMSHQEQKALLSALDQVDFKANCPHGRPVLQRLTLAEIERLFRRH